MIPSVTSCESAEISWPLALHIAPARWEIAIVVAMRSVSDVVILADVNSTFVSPAIVPVIANWLHPKLFALTRHYIGV
jgi:hypothetical protein